ncbi:hypothetical protein ETAA8_42780 [Anatilimnocola aggregata]|uniref:Uncharacterized protein n=1 Tax=Anatilimnocola aggregata TaxID=2528021 RepID=A0A517YG41_9BACT|nr:hypothetical protein [Anatilimnocola aggregata]QDU29171.1 hypothetical protein ETAA8_42780 [Anatilimnocola aggregata]
MKIVAHCRWLLARICQMLRANAIGSLLGWGVLGWCGTATAQHEVGRYPQSGVAGGYLSIQTQPRSFTQPSYLSEEHYPGGIRLASEYEQPERLPQPSAELLQPVSPGAGYVVPEGMEFEEGTYDPLNLPEAAVVGGTEYNIDGTQKLSPYKSGFFQKLFLSAAWLGDGNDPTDLGITEIETGVTVALPAPIRDWPLFITPGYNMYLISDPGGTRDLPPRLNTAYLDLTWAPLFFQHHRLLLSVAPSVYSDFEAPASDGFRVTGKAIYAWDYVPDRLQFVAGVLYLNRDNIRVLPAGGAIWKPTPYFNFELIFPKPKLATRVNVGTGYEDWVFVTAEFGGNTWSILRDDGTPDNVTWQDYRLMGGYERRVDGGGGYRLEVGYVFGRKLEYSSGIGNFDPHSTFIIRGGITF